VEVPERYEQAVVTLLGVAPTQHERARRMEHRVVGGRDRAAPLLVVEQDVHAYEILARDAHLVRDGIGARDGEGHQTALLDTTVEVVHLRSTSRTPRSISCRKLERLATSAM
jgi:hypothetical protein